MLSIAIGTAVLFPFVALAFACVPINYATRYGFRKTQHRATQNNMEIRTITRGNASELLEIIRAAGPHGHREWPTTDVATLVSTLDNPRLNPDLGRWSVAYEQDVAVGYSLVEPELNIGRMIVGLVALHGELDVLAGLLKDGIERATEVADLDEFEIHVAVRENEPLAVTEILNAAEFEVVRVVLKMRVDVADVNLPEALVPQGLALRHAEMSDESEASVVTDLHNSCFSDSWGFSPNTVEEIVGRAATDADRNGFPPILVIENESDGGLPAYIWTTLSEGDGRVEMVGVLPEMRGARLGWVMFNAGVNHLIANGATALVLDVDSENPPARKIYESAGYRTHTKVRYYGLNVTNG